MGLRRCSLCQSSELGSIGQDPRKYALAVLVQVESLVTHIAPYNRVKFT